MFAASKTGAPIAAKDPQFNYVTMLLHGDGTNGAQNNTFLDSSTNNFTITRNGNTTQGTFTPYGSNWSNFLNGSSYFTFGTTASNFLCTGSATGITATFEAWVFLTAYSTGANSYNFSAIHAKGGVYFNFGVRNGAVRFYWYDGAEKNVTSASTSDVPLNTWTHIALTISGSTIKIYINGVLNTTSATYTGVASAGSGTTEYIGLEVNGTYLNGYISNYRFTNTVVYSAAFTPSTIPLTAVSGTALLTCQSNRFVDNSSNNFTITVAGGSPSVQRFSPFSPTTAYSTSVIGGSGYFDGSGDYLSLSQQTALSYGTGDFTIEAWVYPTSLIDFYAVLDTRGPPSPSGSLPYIFGLRNSSGAYKVELFLSDPVRYLASTTVPLNAWTHIAVSRSSGTLRIFVNGAVDRTDTGVTGSIDAYAATQWVGAVFGPLYDLGYITNLRVVKGSAVYTSAFTPPTAPLTAVTNTQLLLNFTNAGILDNAMMNDLETVGNAQISTSVKKYGTGSIALDGTGDYLQAPNNSNLQLGSGSFTIEMWLYTPSLPSAYKRVFGITAPTISAATDESVNLEITNTNKMGATCVVGSTYYSVTDTTDIPTNTWTHWAFVRNGSTITLYRDGTSVSSTSISGTSNWSTTFNVYVGRWVSSSARDYNGYIDDLRITKGVARYTANFTAPTAAFPNN